MNLHQESMAYGRHQASRGRPTWEVVIDDDHPVYGGRTVVGPFGSVRQARQYLADELEGAAELCTVGTFTGKVRRR